MYYTLRQYDPGGGMDFEFAGANISDTNIVPVTEVAIPKHLFDLLCEYRGDFNLDVLLRELALQNTLFHFTYIGTKANGGKKENTNGVRSNASTDSNSTNDTGTALCSAGFAKTAS
jgi:hypothetical protein